MSSKINKPFTCLVMDDDVGFAGMLANVVTQEGGEPFICNSVATARGQLAKQPFDLAILDNKLPDGTGYEFYSQLMRKNPACVAVMITGAPELSQAVELTRNGLFDYLTKPVETEAVAACLRRAKLRLRLPEVEPDEAALLGDSPAMKEVTVQLQQAARHVGAAVLLLGETGSGKDVAARLLHQLTFGRQATEVPYVPVNCPNIPTEMFEAELFGSEKGSYTGADRRRTGLVESAEGGTLFLDEVAEIPLALQSKFLRFLESREYRSLGSTGTSRFTGRVVAATNRSLAEEVKAGRFREDLMYRLDVFTVRLPPLRERLADIDRLATALLEQLCEKYHRRKLRLKQPDLDTLRSHTFPGNVRELRNLMERSLLRTDEDTADLLMDLTWLKSPGAESNTNRNTNNPTSQRQLTPIEAQEYQLISKVLREENGGIRRAATALGITHQTLVRRLQKWPELRQASAASE
jgi:two-component system response regulator AtoC